MEESAEGQVRTPPSKHPLETVFSKKSNIQSGFSFRMSKDLHIQLAAKTIVIISPVWLPMVSTFLDSPKRIQHGHIITYVPSFDD